MKPKWRKSPKVTSKYGRVEAVNMATREVSSGALDRAGGVIFNGSTDRFFRAYDDQTGTVNGKQYLLIGVGNGGARAPGFAPLVPEIQNVDRAPAVWVFQLP